MSVIITLSDGEAKEALHSVAAASGFMEMFEGDYDEDDYGESYDDRFGGLGIIERALEKGIRGG